MQVPQWSILDYVLKVTRLYDCCVFVIIVFKLMTISTSQVVKDLQIPTVKEEISRFSSRYAVRLRAHTNELIATLTEPPTNKRLRRYWPNDLLTRF
jgi:hypothetical protein